MDTDIKSKDNLTNKFLNFCNKNKFKIYILIVISLILAASLIYYKNHLEKKNRLFAESYVKAGLILATGNKEKSADIYRELILSKNTFYSILALNAVVEKNLITDENTILNYFLLVEENIKSKNRKDLLLLKKAIYLMKVKKNTQAENLLKKLIDNKSQFKLLAEEIIAK